MSEKTNIQKVFSSLGINLEIGERFMFEGECYEITESDICIANLSRVNGNCTECEQSQNVKIRRPK